MDAHYNNIVQRMNSDLQDVGKLTPVDGMNRRGGLLFVFTAGLHGETAGGEMMSADTAAMRHRHCWIGLLVGNFVFLRRTSSSTSQPT